jgi:hypothetical protein
MIISFCSLLFSCSPGLHGTKIELKSYSPAFKGDLSAYKGKKINLINFDNQAGNTGLWYYYSADQKFSYGGDSVIHNYFWYAFQNALVNIGMEVSSGHRTNPLLPAMWMSLKSVTDDRFEVRINLQKNEIPFLIKVYTVTAQQLAEEQRTPENLERRAYDMTNSLIETILTDPEFKNAFLKAAAETAAHK